MTLIWGSVRDPEQRGSSGAVIPIRGYNSLREWRVLWCCNPCLGFGLVRVLGGCCNPCLGEKSGGVLWWLCGDFVESVRVLGKCCNPFGSELRVCLCEEGGV